MLINSLRTYNFRNLADNEVLTNSKDIYLIGENGHGKTNILEVIYFCSYASSFRTAHDTELVRNGNDSFSAEIKLTKGLNKNGHNQNTEQQAYNEINIKYENKKKTILIDCKQANDRKELISIVPVIIYCHEDMDFVNGTHERRRWFFDQTLSLYDAFYLDDLRRYKKVLKTRNTVLRDNIQNRNNGNKINSVLDALDPQLAEYGKSLMIKRITAAEKFSKIFTSLYKKVAGIDNLNVQYNPSWKKDDFILYLTEHRSADIAAGNSLTGPHRDRYVFNISIDGQKEDFTAKASTGQKRLLALLLRTAQACCFSEITEKKPVLLLDDVLLEMDGEKRRRFIDVLPAYDQAFFTFLPDEPYLRYCKEDTIIYKVKEGKLSG